MSLTPAQLEAVRARGNVLLMAGAGTGKTHTLVERCLHCLLDPQAPASIDQILVVTFTEAAATEVKHRIRTRLQTELSQGRGERPCEPANVPERASPPGAPGTALPYQSESSRALPQQGAHGGGRSPSFVAVPKDGHAPAEGRGERPCEPAPEPPPSPVSSLQSPVSSPVPLRSSHSTLNFHEQLALFDTACIGTLHSFCYQLVRDHFFELELDPNLAVMPEEESTLLAEETLETLLTRHYEGTTDSSAAVQELIQIHGHNGDALVRSLILRVHHYTQTLADPKGWLDAQSRIFASDQPHLWRVWLKAALPGWLQGWLPLLAGQPDNPVAARCLEAMRLLPADLTPEDFLKLSDEIHQFAQEYPKGQKIRCLKPLQTFLDETAFLQSLFPSDKSPDPLAEDWNWVRPQMATLVQLATEFAAEFAEAKRQLGALDFHDLEQFALRLLWDPATDQPTQVARQWRDKFRFVFVDEYQDINAAQDRIIQMLSRDGAHANRFLVGDIKQSIYRFRLADPHIFQHYAKTWAKTPCEAAIELSTLNAQLSTSSVIPLTENFRSREGILTLVNSIFTHLMRPEIGGVLYDQSAALRFGSPEQRATLARAADPAPRAELHLLLQSGSEPHDDSLTEVLELEQAAREARMVALRLRELHQQQHRIWDPDLKQFRPVAWRDMAVLLRAPSRKAEAYAREFAKIQVPLQVARGNFYQSLEVTDLLSVLQLLDNPLQDLPLLAVLRSPLVGLSIADLAEIRLTNRKGRYWNALWKWHETARESGAPAAEKTTLFLARFSRWRRLARQSSLAQCLETILDDTQYAHWLAAQPQSAQRVANIQRFVDLARQFDQFQRQGLFRFLRFIEAQQNAGTQPEIPAVQVEDAVRLLSIHQSKGLEFPVVAVADLAKSFNTMDLRASIIFDETCGLCPQVKPPHTGKRYPSLPHWLARRRQTCELLGEELRLLYVAMTRARDTLILTAQIPAKKWTDAWCKPTPNPAAALLKARSYADWLALWFSQSRGESDATEIAGDLATLRWTLLDNESLVLQTSDNETIEVIPEDTKQLQHFSPWTYPFTSATLEPAKTSVSILRHHTDEDLEEFAKLQFSTERPRTNAAEIGTAHHLFLQHVSLEKVDALENLRKEADRLEKRGLLTSDQVQALEFDSLLAFWQSDLGTRFRKQTSKLRRELAFTARFEPNELAPLAGRPRNPTLQDEFILVQGIVDLAVILPKTIWILDFKTDAVSHNQAAMRAKTYFAQIELYCRALQRIYRRPVTEAWLYFLAPGVPVPVLRDGEPALQLGLC